MITSTTILHTLGSIVFYHKQNTEHPMGDGKVYYTDKRFLIEQGPFSDIYEANHHWQHFTLPFLYEGQLGKPGIVPNAPATAPVAQVQPAPPDNLIRIDFINKRKL